MFGIGGFELFIILVFGFLIFGPDKLPDIAKTVGKGIARFREAQKEMNEAIGDEKLIDLDNPDEPFKNPVEALDRLAKLQEEKKAAAKPTDSEEAPAEESDLQPKPESFTERKARYERERAARKAAEASSEDPVGAALVPPSADSPESATDDATTSADATTANDATTSADATTANDATTSADATTANDATTPDPATPEAGDA